MVDQGDQPLLAVSARWSDLRLAALFSTAAGLAFLLTVTYLFTVLPASGWDLAMFDEPARLLPWVDDHRRLYQLLWLLYFLSQALLLPVPPLLAGVTGRAPAALGSAAVVLAMVGLAVLFATSPVVAAGFAAAPDEAARSTALLLHDLFADTGKDLRLLSELLLGAWLMWTGRRLRAASRRQGWWALAALGAWTFLVALIKLFVPSIGLEDWLGFLLGLGYLGLGAGLRRVAT